MLEVEVMDEEANHVTNRVGHMSMMHVGLVPPTQFFPWSRTLSFVCLSFITLRV